MTVFKDVQVRHEEAVAALARWEGLGKGTGVHLAQSATLEHLNVRSRQGEGNRVEGRRRSASWIIRGKVNSDPFSNKTKNVAKC